MKLADKLSAPQRRIVSLATEAADRTSTVAYLVGGPVRDLLLDREVSDLDFVAEGDAGEFAQRFASQLGGTLHHNERFLTFRIDVDDVPPIDVVTARSERYPTPGSLPVVTPSNIHDDLRRRDFAANAIAMRLGDEVIVDACGGRADIERHIFRTLHDDSFVDDPSRMLRGVRLGARVSFSFDSSTLSQMQSAVAAAALRTISRERYWREFHLAFDEPDAATALESLAASRLLDDLLGIRADASLDQLQHAMALDQRDADRQTIAIALLTNGAGKVDLDGSGIPLRKQEVIRRAIAEAPALAHQIRNSDAGSLWDICRAVPVEVLATAAVLSPETAPTFAQYVRAERCPVAAGDLQLPPGPHIGEIVIRTRRAVFDGEIRCEEADGFAQRLAITYLTKRPT